MNPTPIAPVPTVRHRRKRDRGVAMITSFGVLSLVMVAATAYIDQATHALRMARISNYEARGSHLCESGVQDLSAQLWQDYKVSQTFTAMDSALMGASIGSPRAPVSGQIADVGRYSAAIIEYRTDGSRPARIATIRAVGWIDHNNNSIADSNEPRKTIDVRVRFGLERSGVFDYAQFVNNYGWVKGFNQNNFVVNGDWRVNGDFDFINGTATINGDVIAAANTKLTPAALGRVNKSPYKWNQTRYRDYIRGNQAFARQMRQAYDPAVHGAIGSAEFAKWRDLVFMSEAQMVGGKPFGATVADANGVRGWIRESAWAQLRTIDQNPTTEIVMPDLNDFGRATDPSSATGSRFARSKAWRNTKTQWADGTAHPNSPNGANANNELLANGHPNPNYAGAYVDVWDDSLNRYVRVSQNGVVDGSALLFGTSSRPIRVHGPVTVNGDIAIGGVIEGQGTLYAARNVHVIANVSYRNAPDFTGNNINTIEQRNQRRDVLGLAAKGSILLGDPEEYTNDEISHMVPPFTKSRRDEYGNLVPAWNARERDSWGQERFRSLLQNNPTLRARFREIAAAGVNRIDAIMYTNNMIGGQGGWNGGGLTVNGSMICKDQAIVMYSVPVRINYDNRIKDRGDTSEPLIDLDLPRGPSFQRLTWQDRGFRMR